MDSIRIKKESLFANRIANERPHLFIDEFRQDSLVTKSLLHMTSYDVTAASADLKLEAMDGFDIDENDPISFDDLGKIYKSISVPSKMTKILVNLFLVLDKNVK